LILVFDALSARHLALYGYHRETTPNLERFARRAVVYHNHHAGGNFTTPGTASLLTGTYPWTHRALNDAGVMGSAFEQRNIFSLLGEAYNRVAFPHNIYAHLLLNQIREGIDIYLDPQTFGLFNDMFYSRLLSGDREISLRAAEQLLFHDKEVPGSLFLALANELKTLLSMGRSRREFKHLYPRGVPYLCHYRSYFLLEDVVRGAYEVLRGTRHPLMAYLHFFPPHNPYRPRAEFVGIFQDEREPVAKPRHFFSQGCSQDWLDLERMWYDEYIAHVDAEFGRMYDSMRKDNLLRDNYVVVTSDHGELFERGVLGHATPVLYEPVIHIPLLIAVPGQEQRRDVYSLTSCVDLLPTLLHLTGRPVPDWCEGRLLPELGGNEDSDRTVYSVEAKLNSMRRPLTRATVAMVRGAYKLIHYFGYEGYESEFELYDLGNDPDELEDLYSPTDPIAADMQSQLELKLREVNRPYV
jgi:arylsulfatase A-like enzyme